MFQRPYTRFHNCGGTVSLARGCLRRVFVMFLNVQADYHKQCVHFSFTVERPLTRVAILGIVFAFLTDRPLKRAPLKFLAT